VKIAYFGMPLGALLLARDGHELVYIGISRDEALGLRRVKKTFGSERYVRPDLSSPATLKRIAALEPELIVSWFWTKRLPAELLKIAPAIGVHPSLLPRHRGPDPYFWAIDSGDEVTGVTAHVLEPEYDTGAILQQVPLRIDPSWNAWTLAKKLDRPSLALLREIVKGELPKGTPQDEAKATEAPAPTDDMLELRWNRPADAIARRVRAAAPWPGAFTDIGGETVVLLDVKPTRDFPRALEPGEAAVRKDGIAVVRAKDDALELRSGRNEGDDALLDAAGIARLLSP
jgi:methionyl-tRNA formyltransferase